VIWQHEGVRPKCPTPSGSLESVSNRLPDSCQSLVNVPSVRANAEAETKPITTVIAMHMDVGKLCFDLGGARRPESEKIAMLGLGAERGDQIRNAYRLDLHGLDPVEKAFHRCPRV
jgi:hypothetical protein